MYKLKLILRYLRRPVGFFPVLAAGLGTYALIVVVAVMNGFGDYIRTNIRGTLSDLVVRADDARGVSGRDELTRKLEGVPGVAAVSPQVSGKALLTVYGTTNDAGQPVVRPVVFNGIDLAREKRTGSLGKGLYIGTKNFSDGLAADETTNGLICGREVFWPLTQGVHVSLTAPTVRDSDIAMSFRVVDYFRSGLSDFDRYTVYISLEAAEELIDNPDAVTGFQVSVAPGHDVETVRRGVVAVLPAGRFTVNTWGETRKVLLAALAMERVVWITVLGSMLIVAGFSVTAVLVILVMQKRRDIGVLRSVGSGVGGIGTVFVGYGLTLGTLGASVGLFLGYLTVRFIDPIERIVLDWTGYTPWPKDVFYFEQIPCQCSPHYMILFFVIAMLISLLAGVYPALRAARLVPVAALRYE